MMKQSKRRTPAFGQVVHKPLWHILLGVLLLIAWMLGSVAVVAWLTAPRQI